MAYSIFITAHGGRDGGTAKGTYVVPPGVNIHVFTDDAVLLKGGIGMAIEDRLTRPALDVAIVNNSATKVYNPFDLIPDYTAYGTHAGDPAFQFATGVYVVGTVKGAAPALPLADGSRAQLGDIIRAFRKAAPGLTDVYWLCCRAVPQNSNNTEEIDDGQYGLIEVPKESGLKPSQVKASGTWR